MRRRVVICVSHPIQHFVPFYKALAAEPDLDLQVLYSSSIGVTPYFDQEMRTTISWDMDLLSGYDHVFLPEASEINSTGFWEVNNPSVQSELRALSPDAVIIYGYSQLTSLRALAWCKRNSVPALMIADSELKTRRSGLRSLVKGMVVPQILRLFSAFLTVGDCNEDYYVRYGVPRERLFRSPFTIDEESYQSAFSRKTELRSEQRGRLGIGDGEVVVLTVGKISERKRVGDVVDAARAVKAAELSTPVRWVVAGNGEQMDRLAQIVDDEDLPVILPGFVNVDVLPSFYAASDIVVHPSSRDPHPLVMSEAACLGLPLVVSSRVGAAGPTDIARPGVNAVVYPVGDTDELARAVVRLVDSPERMEEMGSFSRSVFGELDMQTSVRGLKDALDFVLPLDP